MVLVAAILSRSSVEVGATVDCSSGRTSDGRSTTMNGSLRHARLGLRCRRRALRRSTSTSSRSTAR
jgi:hypothetical protein